MAANDIEIDVHRAMCAAAWIIFLLIQKNIVLLVILAVQRRKNAIYRIPEDANVFGAGQQPGISDDWSLAGRIQRVLANDTEYVPYFLVLLIFMFCSVSLTATSSPHYFARVLVYGILFLVGRYVHTAGYLFRNTYARILGFLITVLVLFILTIDHVYYMTKGLHS